MVTAYETPEHVIGDSGQNKESLEERETVTSELVIEDVKRESGLELNCIQRFWVKWRLIKARLK